MSIIVELYNDKLNHYYFANLYTTNIQPKKNKQFVKIYNSEEHWIEEQIDMLKNVKNFNL